MAAVDDALRMAHMGRLRFDLEQAYPLPAEIRPDDPAAERAHIDQTIAALERQREGDATP
jgi:hypothetical protein